MASPGGRNDLALSERLYAEGHDFDFFQAVRILNRLALAGLRDGADAAVAPAGGDSGDRQQRRPSRTVHGRRHPVGEDAAPRQESARFRALPSLGFPAGAISEVRPPQEARTDKTGLGPPEVTTTMLGLTGPSGVLPAHYTALLIERVRAKDYALCDFLDLFNHRLTSLFYRAWQKYRFPFTYEQSYWASTEEPKDLLTLCLYCLLGLGTSGLRGRLALDDEALLFYAGHFAHYPRPAVSLERLLTEYFELPIRIRQFDGQWLYLSEENQSSLPCLCWPEGLNTQLGHSVIVGQRVWDLEGNFRVRVGPVGYAGFRRLMPSGDMLQPLSQMIRTYVGPQFTFDVQVVLSAAEVPRGRLGGLGGDPSRLGWNTWVLSVQPDHDVSDAVFSWEN
jgi:type VI secretion system protein ImpH